MNQQSTNIPDEIRLNPAKDTLVLSYGNGITHHLPAEYLRVESPSAEVQGHGPGQAVTVGGKRLVTITALVPVGHYAVKVVFSDGHDTGLFTWPYLYELGQGYDSRWNTYLQKLATKNLSRDKA